MSGVYITPAEAGELLGVSDREVRYRVASGELPALRAGRLVRIPRAAIETTPSVVRPHENVPAVVTVAWIAERWGVSARTVHQLRVDGVLPMELRQERGVGRVGAWTMTRAQYLQVLRTRSGEGAC